MTSDMDAILNNPIVLMSLLGLIEWALLGSALAFFISRLYAAKKHELTRLKREQAQKVPESPTPKITDILQGWIEQTEQQLPRGDDDRKRLLQARLAFLQSELIAAQSEGDNLYWDNLCLRLSTIVPEPEPEPEETELEPTPEAAAELLEVPDYLDEPESVGDSAAFDAIDDVPSADAADLELTDDDISDAKNPHIRKIFSSLQKLFASLTAIKSAIPQDVMAEQADLRPMLEQTEFSQAHIKIAATALSNEIANLQQDLEAAKEAAQAPAAAPVTDSVDSELMRADLEQQREEIETLAQQITAREQVIEEQQVELESLRTRVLQLEDELQENAHAVPNNSRIFEETDEPEQLSHQIESLTDLIVQKSEQLAQLEADLPLPDDAFDTDGAMQHALSQQEDNQELLPQLEDVVHPNYVNDDYEISEQEQAMIDDIEDIDLAVEDVDLVGVV